MSAPPRRATQVLRLVLVVAATVAAFALALAIPAWGSEVNADAGPSTCPAAGSSALTYHYGENPLESTAPCAAGPNIAQSHYEAILAGGGVLLFAVGSALYRHQRRGGLGSATRLRPTPA